MLGLNQINRRYPTLPKIYRYAQYSYKRFVKNSKQRNAKSE